MKFFREMNLARAILLLSLLGAGVLLWVGWQQHQFLADLRQANKTAPALVQEVQQLALEHTRLAREMSGDQWIREANPDGYIYRCGDAVGMGLMKFNRSVDAGVARGIVDQRTRIVPDNPRRQFDRYRIAQFLHRLEANSQRVRVTHVKLALVEQARPHEVPSDWWTFEAEITTRVREDDSAQ